MITEKNDELKLQKYRFFLVFSRIVKDFTNINKCYNNLKIKKIKYLPIL